VTALRFDFAGRGESDGLMEELTYQREVEDLAAAVAFLGREVDQVALVGSSMGGAVALLYAALAPEIRAVVGIATVGEPAKVLPGLAPDAPWSSSVLLEGGLGSTFLQSAQGTDVLAAAATVRCPLLLIHGDGDDVVPLAQAQALVRAAPRGQLKVIAGADHHFHRPGDLALLSRQVAQFVTRALSP
jgi:pimeloyl-ACP methyl ester carboxylesterase